MSSSSSSLNKINKRIKKELCLNTINLLKDMNLLDKYKECNSMKKNTEKLISILNNNDLRDDVQKKILDEYILELIPAGTKGVIRGNMFNDIIKKYIESLNLCEKRFNIEFEKKHEKHITTEIPDWYIYDKENNKIIIGMNQLDLWGGGQQLNRGSKYIVNNIHNNENSKLLCVICNDIELKREKNKVYNLFKIGFENDTLCYINNLKNIIYDYFTI